ncbi:hypothetical protein WJU23_16255 [Prosthecobacter sp. SYSU 5D2]|uniref:hypothetical protein n=1 Tax=Prosthecobacter sp. SYSU 5D2 TaxID=3134134 RepID=UPI0031FEA493
MMRCLLSLSCLFSLLSCISFPAAERARYERQMQGNRTASAATDKTEPLLFGLPKFERTATDSTVNLESPEVESAPVVKSKKNFKDPYFRPD